MEINFTPEEEHFIQQQLAKGKFASATEVIEAGLQLFKAEEEWKQYAQSKIERGLAQAEAGQLIPGEEIEAMLSEFTRKRA